jgi:hypothetical protein
MSEAGPWMQPEPPGASEYVALVIIEMTLESSWKFANKVLPFR